ncbi:MAG TPA: GGDEF domain-containing protein [Wenzhouxiangellaceae bacterium]|nr:GGDEF domain-containing protein [Wenzhouxiangellaceae bacterium]
MELKFGRLAILLICLMAGAAFADESQDGASLSDRIAEIERAHIRQPWQVSQQLIEDLGPALANASTEERARVQIMEARNSFLEGRYAEGLETLDRVLMSPVSPARRLRALELSINANYLIHNYERAFDLLARALALFPDTDDARQKADVLTLVSRLYSDMGEHGLALERAAESLDMAEGTGHARTIFNSLYSLMLAQRNAGFAGFAIERSQELWEQGQQAGDPVSLSSGMMLIGSVYSAAGRHEEAIGWLRRAIDKNRETGFLNGELEARQRLGIALLNIGRREEGLPILTSLVDEFQSRENWPSLMAIHEAIADTHEQARRYSEALQHLSLFRNAARRFNDDQRARRLAYLQAEFENQRRNQELQLLRQESRLLAMREETAKAQRAARLLGTAMLVLIGVLLAGLLLRFRADRRRYRRLSETDGLTGLFNHRRFHHAAEDALAGNRAHGNVCALVAADVDLFKQINDRYGHQAGDHVLRKLSALLLDQFPAPCIVGRIGGEEFAIFMPGHNRLQAHQRIGEFRDRIRPIEFDGQSIEVTLSFGLVESRRESRLEKLRARADHALYRAKRAGRNQVIDAADLGNV